MAGYSRLIGADEEGTLARPNAICTHVIERKIAEHHGRLINTTRDGLLAEFASVVAMCDRMVGLGPEIDVNCAKHPNRRPLPDAKTFRLPGVHRMGHVRGAHTIHPWCGHPQKS